MIKSTEYRESNLLSSKNIGLCSIGVWLSGGNDLFMLNRVSKVTLAGKNSCPAFCITDFNITGIEEEVCEVINRVYAEISTGLNQGEVESRNLCTALCNIEKRRLPIQDVFSDLFAHTQMRNFAFTAESNMKLTVGNGNSKTATFANEVQDQDKTAVDLYGTINTPTYVAVDSKNNTYETLAAAVLGAGKNETVTLLCDASGSGLITLDVKKEKKDKDNNIISEAVAADSRGNITIDLGGHTYTMKDPAVGSSGYETQAMHWGPSASSVTMKNGTFKVAKNAKDVKMAMQSHTTFSATDMIFDFSEIEPFNYGTFTGNNAKFNGKEVGVFGNNKGKTMTLTRCEITMHPNSQYGITADDAEIDSNTEKEYGGELILDDTIVNGKVNLCSKNGKLTVKGNVKIDSKKVVSYFDGYTVAKSEGEGVDTYTLKENSKN